MYGSGLSVLQKCMVACTYGTSESVLSEMAAEPIDPGETEKAELSVQRCTDILKCGSSCRIFCGKCGESLYAVIWNGFMEEVQMW